MATRRTGSAPKPRRGELVITDPRAMRALAHPARMTVIDELFSGRESTASELAELTGLTPSAMSYHLRALEKWGVVARAEARGDGRERPWKAMGTSLSVHADDPSRAAREHVSRLGSASASTRATLTAIGLQSVDRLRDGLTRWFAARADDPFADTGRISNGYHYLTADQADALAKEMDALVRRYKGTGRPTAGRRRMAVFYAIYPADHPTDPDQGAD